MTTLCQRRPHRHAGARRRSRNQRGAIAILVGLSLAMLVGFVGLALDLGKLYVAKSELQNSADACALAASRDITGATPLSVSEAAGMAAGQLNMVLFQHEAVVLTPNHSVTYSDSLTDPFYDKSTVSYPLSAISYVKCSVTRSGIANWFIQVLNLLPGVNIGAATVSSVAVATTTPAQTACAIPVFVCTPASASPSVASYPVGQWLTSKVSSASNGTYGGGNFGWANLNPGGKGGASALAAQLDGAGQCNLPAVGAQIGSPGNISSLADDWNSRFGIIPPSGTKGVTDFTGYAYTPTTYAPQFNAFPDFINQRKTFAPYQGDQATGLKTKGNPASSSTYAAGADRRVVLAPMVDCSGFATSGVHQVSVVSWACVLMLDPMQQGGNINDVFLEYRGQANQLGSPCATQGVPGASNGAGPLVPVLVQ